MRSSLVVLNSDIMPEFQDGNPVCLGMFDQRTIVISLAKTHCGDVVAGRGRIEMILPKNFLADG